MNLTKSYKKAIVAVSAAAVALLFFLLPSCKGRTMENMEPTGETVEVVIDSVASVDVTDSIANQI